VEVCDMCVQENIMVNQPYGLLQPFLAAENPWSFFSMELIIGFSCSKSFNSILVVINQLTNMAHFILTT
jgi:hypothetical protein